MSAHEKAAGMLGTSEAALKTTHTEFTPENDLDFPTGQRPDQKRLANLIAQFALAGHAVHKGRDLDFTVIYRKYGMSRYCQDFAALQAFAKMLGVKPC
ncbi:hypothetical protein [Rhodoferax sp.]|uniref:hypothetical protein n=1 Tax=Rhodoferax sp. TaxID=50421 RepID=UPI0027485568|nr:hypothetical protein [Rhodoferax sp.]